MVTATRLTHVHAVDSARSIAQQALAEELPERWAHVCAVAARATALSAELEAPDDEALQVAAWLHDIGYSRQYNILGFHPLDGAEHLNRTGHRSRIAGLVAYHSAAQVEAVELGIYSRMAAFTDERTIVRDLLWYCDMTTGPDGTYLSFRERIAEVRNRYPERHYVGRALDRSMPMREAAVRRAEDWIAAVGLTGHV